MPPNCRAPCGAAHGHVPSFYWPDCASSQPGGSAARPAASAASPVLCRTELALLSHLLHSASCARCDDDWQTRVHEPGRCATYGICGHRRDSDPLSCPDNGAARTLNATSAQKLQEVCPQLAANVGPGGGVCCTEEQLDQLQKQVGQTLVGLHSRGFYSRQQRRWHGRGGCCP